MSRLTTICPEFVELIPKELEDGVLYISVPYGTTVHSCACGCGSKVTLPISPAKWQFLWDGDAITLWPSVGNWSYPCQSHYVIKQNRIVWAAKMSREKIEANRARDRADRERYLKSRTEPAPPSSNVERTSRRGLLERLRQLIRR